jgi:hypothetical protein
MKTEERVGNIKIDALVNNPEKQFFVIPRFILRSATENGQIPEESGQAGQARSFFVIPRQAGMTELID